MREINQYIYVAEESINQDEVSLTPKWKNMKFLDKIIIRHLTPALREMQVQQSQSIDEIKDAISNNLIPSIQGIQGQQSQSTDEINRIFKYINDLKQENIELKSRLDSICQSIDKNELVTATLLNEYNSKKAGLNSKYKTAIDVLYSLRTKFIQNVATFGRSSRLELLQMLVNYLYEPSDALKDAIISSSHEDKKTASILSEIENFNDKYRNNVISYLTEKGKVWSQCVIFPNDSVYHPNLMSVYNDADLEEGTPVFIVALGYSFPDSNSEEVSPIVFKRTI